MYRNRVQGGQRSGQKRCRRLVVLQRRRFRLICLALLIVRAHQQRKALVALRHHGWYGCAERPGNQPQLFALIQPKLVSTTTTITITITVTVAAAAIPEQQRERSLIVLRLKLLLCL